MRAIAVFSPTCSSGKSWFATALCRWLAREDWSVVPFQAQAEVTTGYTLDQNVMVSHSIAWQAWAANIPVHGMLNPVTLKPQVNPNLRYQLFIQGRGIGTISRTDYYQNYFNIARPLIQDCFKQLQKNYKILVFDTYRHGLYNPMLSDTDENFELLKSSPFIPCGVILVDCQYGGELNQLWGLWQRLSEENRQLVRGVIFNQWEGDRRLFDLKTRWVQENLNRPVLGYIPPLLGQFFQPESPLTFGLDPQQSNAHQLKIQILKLPHLSHFSDFDALDSEPSVQLNYLEPADQLGYPDALIIPHTTAAIADLKYLQKYTAQQQLQNYAAAGGTILGIGNGAHLLSKTLIGADNPQDNAAEHPGFGLMPYDSYLHNGDRPEMCQTLSEFPFPNLPIQGEKNGYGIIQINPKVPTNQLFSTKDLGLINQGRTIWAIYLHGLFNNGPWRRFWLNQLRQKRGLSSLPTGIADFTERREVILDSLANHIDQYLELSPLLTDYDY